MLRKVLLSIAVLLSVSAAAQLPTEEYRIEQLGRAVYEMDNGSVRKSIRMLTKLLELYPNDAVIIYELATGYCLNEDYKSAIKILEELILNSSDVNDQIYAQLGNAYDMDGRVVEALQTYRKGLEYFPLSGRLYCEIGVLYLRIKEYAAAIQHFETGIVVAPRYAPNYLRAAELRWAVGQKLWAFLYGEIFMNLEQGTLRTHRMGQMLSKTWQEMIKWRNLKIEADTTVLMQQAFWEAPEDRSFENLVSAKLTEAFNGAVKALNAQSIDAMVQAEIRARFVKLWFWEGSLLPETYPNPLFDYWKKLLDEGQLVAYSQWMTMGYDPDAFEDWQDEHPVEWGVFVKWMEDNPIGVNEANFFVRKQYNN